MTCARVALRRKRRVSRGVVHAAARAGSIEAILAAFGFLAWGCGGNVAGDGPVDGSSGADGSGGTNLDAGKPDGSPRDATTNVDAAPCSIVLASDYDQSCKVDTDCVTVGEVSSCPANCTAVCASWTISKNVAAQYMTALSRTTASMPLGDCNCPGEGFPCCRNDSCTTACPLRTDTLPACADAGGYCTFPAGAGCGSGTAGPPDACAYSDERCCIN